MKFRASFSRMLAIILLLAALLILFGWRSDRLNSSRLATVIGGRSEQTNVAVGEGGSALRPISLEEARKLVVRFPQDFVGGPEGPEEIRKYQEALMAKAREEDYRIAHTPGLTVQLLVILEEHHREGSDATPSIVDALCLRKDLTAADLAALCEEMKRVMEKPVSEWDLHANIYLAETIRLLEKFPSEDNERIALQVLSLRSTPDFSQTKRNAAKVLQAYGSERSLQPLLDAEAIIQPYVVNPRQYDVAVLAQIREAIKAVRARIKK